MTQLVETVAGVLIGISAGVPATFDATGYAALTYTNIGEITDGGSHGRKYALVTHKPIASRGTQKYKGSFDEGQKTLQVGLDDDEPGQVLAKTASKSDANYAFKVTYQGGSVDYFQAKVMSFEKATGNVDSIRSGTIMLELTTSATGIGIVEVAGA